MAENSAYTKHDLLGSNAM